MKRAAVIVGALLLSACATPDRMLLDGEYGSDRTGAASAVLQWDAGSGYVEAGALYDPTVYGKKPRAVVRAGTVVNLK